MEMGERTMVRTAVVIAAWCLMIWMVMYTIGESAVGNKCNWSSDCGLNETCRSVPYHQRDGSSYTGICVPKGW
jgi:hypothetical protein